MEIHTPEHAIHTWRDFFIHIATIVVGLLIAIGLEQSVEALHHRHLVQQAREQLHVEIAGNVAIAQDDDRLLTDSQRAFRYNMQLVDSPSASGAFHLGWSWNGPRSAAWRTARDTGALGFFPYDDVQRLSVLYEQQDVVDQAVTAYIQHYNRSMAPILRHGDLSATRLDQLSQEERKTLGDSFAELSAETSGLQDLLRGLRSNYAQFQQSQLHQP